MAEEHLVNLLDIADFIPLRQRARQFIQLLRHRICSRRAVSALPFIPQITQVVIAVTPEGIRIFLCKCNRGVEGIPVQLQVILLIPVVWNVHQTHRPFCHFLFHDFFRPFKHPRFQVDVRDHQYFHTPPPMHSIPWFSASSPSFSWTPSPRNSHRSTGRFLPGAPYRPGEWRSSCFW